MSKSIVMLALVLAIVGSGFVASRVIPTEVAASCSTANC
jgi:hypothetical protein